MSRYFVEVIQMTRNGKDWISRGFHQRGHGVPGDSFVIAGRSLALPMSLEAARRRVELYRAGGHKARILDSADRIVLDFDEPLIEPQQFTRENSHREWQYRGLIFIENRITGKFYHVFRWPIADGAERSVSGGSCEEVVEIMQGMPDVLGYLAAHLDKLPPPESSSPEAQPHSQLPETEVELGSEVIGYRPGSIRL
jgi:hypothetical protein